MTPDPEKVKEALDHWHLFDHHGHQEEADTAEAVMRSWLSGSDIQWCETHKDKAHPACFNSVGTPHEGHGRICRIVTRRLSGGTE